MTLELAPRNSPYYDGSPVVFVDNDHFIYKSGANLLVTNARNGQSVGFIYPTERCRRGISAYTTNPKQGLVAIARRCRPPTIDVVAWPSKGASQDNSGPPYISEHLGQEVKAMATGGAALEYGAVALSRKGERLAAISVLADYVLTVWDLPSMDQSDYTSDRAPEAVLVASVVLPCVCDTVSFNPSNPSMIAVTATSAHHDGVGGGHAGGLFLYNISTSHGHTSLVLTEAKLEDLPPAYNIQVQSSDLEAASNSSLSQHPDEAAHQNESENMLPAIWNEDSAVGDGHGEEEDEEEALHRGFHPHAVGGLSVAVAVWGRHDVVYVGTTAGVIGEFYALTGELLRSWTKGLNNGSPPSPVAGLVLTKNFLVVASRAKMLYWLDLKSFQTVEHTATIFGIRDVNPPERVAHLTHSPNFRSLVVTTLEGTIHEHTVEPPADLSKRSVVTGIPDILPILLDYHEAFVLCVTATHIPMVVKDPKAMPGTTQEVELYATGGSDGNLRVWWASDGAPAAAKSYRALKPAEPQEVSDYDSEEDDMDDNDGNSSMMADDQAALDALEDNLDDMGENQMIAVSEDTSENSQDLDDDEDPFELPPVPVTALAAMPGRPVLAVGLADGELSLLFLHDEAGHNAVNSGDSIGSGGSSQRMRRVSSRGDPTANGIKYTHPHGANISLMPLDLKQMTRKPLTHLCFGGGDTTPCVLAVGCAAEGSVHIIEMTEPDNPSSELVSPPVGGPPPNIFRVLARFEVGVGQNNASGGNSTNGSVAGGSMAGSKGPRIASLLWASSEVLLVGTSDGAVYSYAINGQPLGADGEYSPTTVANTPSEPVALLRNAGVAIDPSNGGGGLPPSSDDADTTPFTNMIIVPENLHSEEAVSGGSLVCFSPAAKTPALYELPPLSDAGLKRAVKDIQSNQKSYRTARSKTGGDSDSDIGGITETEDEANEEEIANETSEGGKHGVGFNGLPLLDLSPHPTVFSNFIQKGHSLGIGCSALCNIEANGADGTALIATGGVDGSIILWKINNQGITRVSDFQVHAAPVVTIAFSSSGTSIISACLDRAVVITAVRGLFPAPIGENAASGPGGFLSNNHMIGDIEQGHGEEESLDDDSIREGSLSSFEGRNKSSKSGFVAVALLKRASSIDHMNMARQHEKSFNFKGEGRQRLTPQEEQMRMMLAMGNLNGPLPAPLSVMTWVEAAQSVANMNTTLMGSPSKLNSQNDPQMLVPDSPLRQSMKDTSKVMDLAIRLEELLVKNDNASDLEKLPREVFVVDLKRRDAAIAINKSHAARVREEIEEEDAARDLISARILATCEGGMEAKAKEVHALKEEHCIVPNLPVPKLSQDRARKLECVKRLRMIEMKEIQYAKKNLMKKSETSSVRKGVWNMPQEVPDDVAWIANQGKQAPSLDVVGDILQEEKNKKAKKNNPEGGDGGGQGGDDDVEKKEDVIDEGMKQLEIDGDEGSLAESVSSSLALERDGQDLNDSIDDIIPDASDIRSYLYPPTCLRTTSQRRAQVLFLDELVRIIKFNFNKHVDQLAALKLDEMEKIEERNVRILEISKSLELPDTTFKPMLSDNEKPENYLMVNDDELVNKPYETEEMKLMKKKLEEDRLARESKNKGDDLGTRALNDMMYGTLETKKEGALEKTLPPMPDWMLEFVNEDKVNDMNDEQREQYEDYLLSQDEFERLKQEEKDLLLEEMSHLQLEIDEIIESFDDKVKEIRDLRVHAQLSVATQELYMMRLGIGLDEGELLAEHGRQLETSRFKVNVQKIDLDEQAAKWHKQVNAAKEKLAELHEEDIRMEKTFRRSLTEVSEEPITNDIYKVYLSMFKLRRDAMSQHSGSGMHNSSTGAGRSSQRGAGSIHNRRSTKAGMKPTLLAAAGSLMGARRQTTKGVGFMGIMKAAAKDDEAKILAEAADPFAELDTNGGDAKKSGGDMSSAKRLADAAEQAAYAPLDEMDIPDGFKVSKNVWEKLQQLRIDKIKCEVHIRKLTKKVNEMTKSTENIDTRDDAIALELKHVEHDMAILSKRRLRNAKDFEVITQLHQGQNELLSTDLSFLSKFTPAPPKKVSQMEKSEKESMMHKKYPPLSVDMSGGILIDTEKIKLLNESIKAVGAEKVKSLNKIKHFRKSINYMTWEDKYMSAKLQDGEEFYTDLLLLRVEKSTLQAMRIGGGGGSTNDKKNNVDDVAAKHERREDMTKQAFAVKEERQIASNMKLSQQISDRRNENEKLRDQLTQLENNIKIREAIYRARVPGGGGGEGDAAVAARMKKVTMRRRLVDLARVQTEEIEFLRGELDRLRQRTFPSFAHAAKHRLQLPPDEII